MRKLAIVMCWAAVFSVSATAGNWWENIKPKGDFRYRHEMIDKDGSDARHRHRIRARLGIEAKVNQTTKIAIRLATGSDNPVSTNQTLDNDFSTKNIMLDLAYFEMTPEFLSGTKLKAGKFKNPFFKPGKSELLWDSDLNPEGGVATFKKNYQDVSVTVIAAGLWIDERSSANDSWMGAGQGILRYRLNEKKSSIAIGGGYFNYVETAGFAPFYNPDKPMGNSVDTIGLYIYDYELLELYGEVIHQIGRVPVIIMGDFVANTAADSLNNGWLAGIRIGKTKKPGSWTIRYIYRRVEKDAVLGAFTDSDFRGGGTDAKGHEIGGAYQLSRNSTFKISYFSNTTGLDREESGYKRLQVDLQLKF